MKCEKRIHNEMKRTDKSIDYIQYSGIQWGLQEQGGVKKATQLKICCWEEVRNYRTGRFKAKGIVDAVSG